MFEIEEVTYYETQDGEIFADYDKAEAHNIHLMEKEIPINEIRVFNRDGIMLPAKAIFDYDDVWFFYAETDNGARFLENVISEHISDGENFEVKPRELYRYDEDEECWMNQYEELDRLNDNWMGLVAFEEARY